MLLLKKMVEKLHEQMFILLSKATNKIKKGSKYIRIARAS